MVGFPRPILLFDGGCCLCDGMVRWLLRHDRGRLHYAPLDSETGRQALRETGRVLDTSTVLLIDEHGAHQRSEAAWRVLHLLDWPWRAGAGLRFLPRFVRDVLYRFVAQNRFRIFGRPRVCTLVSSLPQGQQARILN